MTNIDVVYVDNKTVSYTNKTGGQLTVEIFFSSPLGSWTSIATVTLNVGQQLTYRFNRDGVYRIKQGSESNIFVIYGHILDHLKVDVKDILLNTPTTTRPSMYDFVGLVLLSISFFGSSQLTNINVASYVPSTHDPIAAKYSDAIDHCINYMDIAINTPQANNQPWK